MIKFKCVRWKNFLSTGNSFIEMQLDTNDIKLIVGRNGAGKSQSIDALCFGLFKKPIRKIKLAQLINSINKKDTVVEVEFQNSQSINYLVRRGLKPNIFEIYCEGELLPIPANMDDYQEMLEKTILGLNAKTFKQVDVLTSAAYIPFMELAAGDRRSVVEDLLDGKVYGLMAKLAKIDIEQLAPLISNNKSRIEVINMQLRTLRSTLATLNQAHTSSTEMYRSSIDEKLKQISVLEKTISKCDFEMEEFKKKTTEIPIRWSEAEKALDQLKTAINDSTYDANNRRKIVSKFTTIGVCEVCQQEVAPDHKYGIINSNNDAIIKIEKDLIKSRKRITKVKDIIDQYNAISNSVADLLDDRKSAVRSIQNLQREISQIEQRIEKVSSETGVVEQIESTLAQVNELETELVDVQKSYDDQWQKVSILKKCIAVCSDSGIKSKIVGKYLPLIVKTINYYLEKMDLFVEFELDEQFNETIKARYRDEFSYESFSEGQKARINLAILLTWRKIAKLRNSVASNILILDEVFDGSLDSMGSSELLNIIQGLNDEGVTVIVISHNETHKDTFPTVFEASLEGNYTVYNQIR